jgi:1,4-dihydroxy-2-naphthoate octaprenyltransferase
MATLQQWISGARPLTLPAAVAPVLAGTGAAVALHAVEPLRALLALIVTLGLQIGVNYANDYSDGIRGTDDVRIGPFRLTGSRAASPRSVLAAAMAAFGLAVAAGVWLIVLCGLWWLFLILLASLPAAWFYTGGRRPYGYRGLGEVFVFVFFGLVAVLGTTYSQAGHVSLAAWCAAVGIGALASAILVVNNLRDIDTDAASGKITLAVRLGDRNTRVLYISLLIASQLMLLPIALGHPWSALTLLLIPQHFAPVRAVAGGVKGKDLLPVLRRTGRIELCYGLVLGATLMF